jgi:osmotically-inducible protein OsmY
MSSATLESAALEDETTLLHEQVLSALRENPHLRGRSLRFETHERRVTLRGQVTSWYQKQMAQEMLLRLDGVDQVDNHLEVCRD